MLILEVWELMAQSFHRFSWHLPSVLKTSKLSMSKAGGSRPHYNGQAAHWAMSLCCFPGLGEPRTLGTCVAAMSSWLADRVTQRLNHRNQKLTTDCLGMLVQREGMSPAGNVMGSFLNFIFYSWHQVPVACLKNGLEVNVASGLEITQLLMARWGLIITSLSTADILQLPVP